MLVFLSVSVCVVLKFRKKVRLTNHVLVKQVETAVTETGDNEEGCPPGVMSKYSFIYFDQDKSSPSRLQTSRLRPVENNLDVVLIAPRYQYHHRQRQPRTDVRR